MVGNAGKPKGNESQKQTKKNTKTTSSTQHMPEVHLEGGGQKLNTFQIKNSTAKKGALQKTKKNSKKTAIYPKIPL